MDRPAPYAKAMASKTSTSEESSINDCVSNIYCTIQLLSSVKTHAQWRLNLNNWWSSPQTCSSPVCCSKSANRFQSFNYPVQTQCKYFCASESREEPVRLVFQIFKVAMPSLGVNPTAIKQIPSIVHILPERVHHRLIQVTNRHQSLIADIQSHPTSSSLHFIFIDHEVLHQQTASGSVQRHKYILLLVVTSKPLLDDRIPKFPHFWDLQLLLCIGSITQSCTA